MKAEHFRLTDPVLQKEEKNVNEADSVIKLQRKLKALNYRQISLSDQYIQLREKQMKEIETLLQKQFNEQLQNQINYSKNLEKQINQLQNKLTTSEKEITDINKQLNVISIIKGKKYMKRISTITR